MVNYNSLCHQFGQILNAKSSIEDGVCSVEIKRNIPVTIQGRLARGEMAIDLMFESLDDKGNALNRGEAVILEEEIPSFMHSLVKNGIIISAVHNHWLYTKPDILYIHFQSIESPLSFAYKIAEAIRLLKVYKQL